MESLNDPTYPEVDVTEVPEVCVRVTNGRTRTWLGLGNAAPMLKTDTRSLKL